MRTTSPMRFCLRKSFLQNEAVKKQAAIWMKILQLLCVGFSSLKIKKKLQVCWSKLRAAEGKAHYCGKSLGNRLMNSGRIQRYHFHFSVFRVQEALRLLR